MTDKLIDELNTMEDRLEKDVLQEIVLISEGAARDAQDVSTKIGSGFTDLDNCMDGGFREGDFTIISGIPGDGKTTFCRMITLNLAEQDVPSLWFSHEMTKRELWEAFEKMGAPKGLISYVPMELEDDIEWMFRHCDAAIAQYGIKAIFIDTLGDVVKSVKRMQDMGNYANYLAQICKDLRRYAIKNKVMIFSVAHATKQTRSKSNETDNSDIANSNGIPAAATNIFHVWRDDESNNLSYVKIGKSRRDGSKKGYRYKFRFINNKFIPEGRYEKISNEDVWRSN